MITSIRILGNINRKLTAVPVTVPLSSVDTDRLSQAIALARRSIGISEPNPRVGCLLYGPNGEFAGSGFTQPAGGPHAEVMALRAARDTSVSLRGGCAWVSLEPCAHHGRTGPCCDALIDAGLSRVIVAVTDPNPLVAGKGIARLRAAGIEVELACPGNLQEAAVELNIGFFARMQRRRPWVRLKVAASLDGRTALLNGQSQWITCPAARQDGHAWRRRAGAILTGSGTVDSDDPRLNVRDVHTAVQPLRVVVDSSLGISLSAKVLKPPGQVLLICSNAPADRAAEFAAKGFDVADLPGDEGKVNLVSLLSLLADREINELHVEAGPTLNAALLQADLVDEMLIYLAPKMLGIGLPMANLPALTQLSTAMQFEFMDLARLGQDARLIARRIGRWPVPLG